MSNEPENLEIVTTTSTALEQMERASIDVQITTAKKYPRELSVVKAQMLSFATLDVETAAGTFFTLPGRKGGDGKPIQGPSIRMAEIAISSYQNLRAGARIIADDGKVITAQGVCHDLQNNVCISVEVKRRVTTKDGRRYSDDMVVMTGNAACSIALRNATFRVVPLALVKPIYEAAKKVAIGDAKTLGTRRADALAHFTKMGVGKEKVFATLGVKGVEDIGLEHLEVLIGYANAIRDGDTSVDEVFNPKPEVEKKGLGDIIGKTPDASAQSPSPEQAPGSPSQTQADTAKASGVGEPPAPKYTAEQRQAILKAVEDAMLTAEVGESRVLKWVFEQGLRKEGQDEVATLDTAVLDQLRTVIPTLKRGVAK